MRIDASSLLLAAQVQAQRPQQPAKAPAAVFEALDFAKPAASSERKSSPQPGAISRPGALLDIKI